MIPWWWFLAAGLGLAAGAAAQAQALPECGDAPAHAPSCAVPARFVHTDAGCDPDLPLAQAYVQSGMRHGLSYADTLVAARKMRAAHAGLRFRITFRPVDLRSGAHDKLLAMNPHDRSDVKVCKTHEVELYVGWAPFWRMPAASLVGRTRADAEAALAQAATVPKAEIRFDGPVDPGPAAQVVAQWPAPGDTGIDGHRLSQFEPAAQKPVLFIGQPARTPAPAHCEDPSVDAGPPPSSSPRDPGDSSTTVAATAGALGIGTGLGLARLSRAAGSSAPPVPRLPTTPSPSLPLVRVRPDPALRRDDEGTSRG